MYCTKCGKELADGTVFCTSCGERQIANDNVQGMQDNGFQGESMYSEFAPDVSFEKKGFSFGSLFKSKKFIGIGAGVVGVAAVAGAIASPAVRNMAMKAFLSPEKYFQHVMKSGIKDPASDIASIIVTAKDSMFTEGGASGNFEITAGEGLYDFIADNGGSEALDYIDWLNKIGISYDGAMSGDAASTNMSINVNDEKMITANVAMDYADGSIYLTVPELNTTAVRIDMGVSEGTTISVTGTMDVMREVLDAVPEEKVIEKIITRYMECIADNVTNVEEESDTIDANGISQKCTLLTVTIDDDTARAVAEAVLTELRDDKEIEEIINNFATVEELNIDADEVYSSFIDAIDEGLNNIDEISFEEEFEIEVWVNGDGKVIGIGAEEEGTEIYIKTAEKGSNYGVEIGAESNGVTAFKLEGEGKVSWGKRSGEFEVKVMGMEALNITLSDLDEKKFEKGIFNGTVSLELGSSATSMLGMSGSEVASLLEDARLEFKGTSKSEKNLGNEISLYVDDELFVKLTADAKTNNNKKVEIPGDYVDADSSDDMESWVEDIDYDALLDSLEAAGAPSDITDMLEDEISRMY